MRLQNLSAVPIRYATSVAGVEQGASHVLTYNAV
jgi:hypothetical protein